MKKIESVCKKAIEKAIDGERSGWPPVCAGFFFQPKRPENEASANQVKRKKLILLQK